MDWGEEEGSTVLMAAAGNLDLGVDVYWEVANTMVVEEGKHRKGKVVVEESCNKEVVMDYNNR